MATESNELVISLNTVIRHVSNIFAKLVPPTGRRQPASPSSSG
jgi:ATP/maltotriose-dependent transcriptional regulator MalT